MISIFRTFKRHYHKVVEAYQNFSNDDSFKFEINFQNNNLQVRNTLPGGDKTTRFVILMSPFLSPSNPIYYRNVWDILREQFIGELSDETINNIESFIERFNKGCVAIKINDDKFTAEKIYQIISKGEYFGHYEEPRTYLNSLRDIPVIKPLFWYQFYQYTLDGLDLVSDIFNIILEIEQTEKYKSLYPDFAITTKRCIYCLSTTGTFSSEEHILPESLGNDELVLPKGCVCDTCNNGILATLDECLLQFEPIAFLRVMFLPYTKQGKLPHANFQNMSIKKTRPHYIKVTAKDETGMPKNEKHLGDDWYSFDLQVKGKPFNPKQLARALYKIALGMAAFDKGYEQAYDSKYDAARNFILKNQDFPNNLILRTVFQPIHQIHVTSRHDIPQGTPFVISIYGIVFMFNLEIKPVMELTKELNQSHFVSIPLHS
jgi:hypothetical protein